MRIFAFLVAGVSAILVPADLAAAAAGHVAPGTAFAIAGALSALTLATIAVARNFDPLRR